MARGKKRLADVCVDEFMKSGLDLESSDSDSNEVNTSSGKKLKRKPSKMKQSMNTLKQKDPEFYNFISKEEPGLLNFNESDDSGADDDDDSSGEDSSSDDNEEDTGVHQLPTKLEVASDDSEAEFEDEFGPDEKRIKKTSLQLVTLKMVKQWSSQLRNTQSLSSLHDSVSAFRAAVHQAGGHDVETTEYKVEGSTVFNAVVTLCITEVLPAVLKFLQLPEAKTKDKTPLPSSSKKWSKLRPVMKSYCATLIQMLSAMSEATILNVLLKHVHQLVTFFVSFPKIYKVLVKKLINMWSVGEETTRVLAFFSIIKLTRLQQKSLLEPSLKQMYVAYVKNCKFTSPTTLPLINFMQRSLVEMFCIDVNLTYQYAFVYIRQLAIHLRNAITVKKKETMQSVYNWQFVHSLFLWARLLGLSYPSDALQPLIYPLTQTIIGTIGLVPTARYYPLRFQCIRALNMLSQSTNTFIPTLPFLLEVLETTDFNKRHSAVNIKPLNFACMLKLSKSQLNDKGFKDGVIDQLYEHFMETLNVNANSIGFPELLLPAVIRIKAFLKNCKVANYGKQMKQILEKVEENSKFITQKRKITSFDVRDFREVNAWDQKVKQEGTPLGKYYSSWRKLRDRELQYEIAGKERISDDKIPQINRTKLVKKATDEDRKEFSALFDSDSEESLADDQRFLPKNARKKKDTAKDQEESNYSDFDEDELEQLAASGDDDDDDTDTDTNIAKEDVNNAESDLDSSINEGTKKGPNEMEDDNMDGQEDIVEDFKMSSSDEEEEKPKIRKKRKTKQKK